MLFIKSVEIVISVKIESSPRQVVYKLRRALLSLIQNTFNPISDGYIVWFIFPFFNNFVSK